jgi:hypothetical protein
LTDVKATCFIDQEELAYIGDFRAALSEPDHQARVQAIRAVRHFVTANRLADLFASDKYATAAGPNDYPFVRWAAETAIFRLEAMEDLSEANLRYAGGNERKLNVAEEIGLTIFSSVKDARFWGIHTSGGILEQVREKAKEAEASGGRDTDTLRKAWNCYRGVVHFGMAITYLAENPDQHWHPILVADFFQEILSTSCPKGTHKPYVPASEQIKFVYGSRAQGPRYRDRGLPFFHG